MSTSHLVGRNKVQLVWKWWYRIRLAIKRWSACTAVYSTDDERWLWINHGMRMFFTVRSRPDSSNRRHYGHSCLLRHTNKRTATSFGGKSAVELGISARQWPKAYVASCPSMVHRQSNQHSQLAVAVARLEYNRKLMGVVWSRCEEEETEEFEQIIC